MIWLFIFTIPTDARLLILSQVSTKAFVNSIPPPPVSEGVPIARARAATWPPKIWSPFSMDWAMNQELTWKNCWTLQSSPAVFLPGRTRDTCFAQKGLLFGVLRELLKPKF